MWFAEREHRRLGRLRLSDRQIVGFPLPRAGDDIGQIRLDSRGRLWFTTGKDLGRFDPQNETWLYFQVPDAIAKPRALACDATGRIWVACGETARVANFDPDGRHYRVYSLPSPGTPIRRMTVDASGALWFTEPGNNRIGRIEDTGH